jgi:hypothetical protein
MHFGACGGLASSTAFYPDFLGALLGTGPLDQGGTQMLTDRVTRRNLWAN